MLFKFDYQGRQYSLTLAALCIATLCACATETGLVIASWMVPLNPLGSQALGFVALVFLFALSGVLALASVDLLVIFFATNAVAVLELKKRWGDATTTEKLEIEESPEEKPAVYESEFFINDRNGRRVVSVERPLTLGQIELGRALQALFLHAWNYGEDISSTALVGKEKPLSSTDAWGELTDYAHQMGFVQKGNGIKTKLTTTYPLAVAGVWGRLSRVSVPIGYKAPKIAPPPQEAWSKIVESEHKAESSIKHDQGQ